MFSYFHQLLKPQAIVLMIFSTLQYSPSYYFCLEGYSKIKTIYSQKLYEQIFKVLINTQCSGHLKALSSYAIKGMYKNSMLLDTIDREAIKIRAMPTIRTAFLVTASYQDLLFKSYANNTVVWEKFGVKNFSLDARYNEN